MVTSKGKEPIEDYFLSQSGIENYIKGTPKESILDEVNSIIGQCEFDFVQQKQMLGLGHAIFSGRKLIGNNPLIRFDQPASVVLPAVVDSGLEHHMVLAYGDYRQALCQVAAALDLPVIILGEEHG